MGIRGRQSTAALAVVGPGGRRPDPPPGLTVAESEMWRSVAQTKPPDWFTQDTHPLLTAYCRASSAAEVIAQQVAAFQPEWMDTPEGLIRYDKLTQIQYRQAMLLSTLATKMRLAQQSRYNEGAAHTAAKHAIGGTKPWQRVASGS